MPDQPTVLPAVDTDPEQVDHPDEVTDEEAAAGQACYLTVDDLDDDSTGLDEDGDQ